MEEYITDKELLCRDCRGTFTFSTAEQEFFKQKGLVNEPKRCPNCRLLLRSQKPGSAVQQTAEVPCSGCSRPTRVPFLPNGHKPVLCNACFYAQKDNKDPSVAQLPVNDDPLIANAG